MNRRMTATFAGMLLVFLSCSRSFSPVEPQATNGNEAAVYFAILNEMGRKSKMVVVIPDSTEDFTVVPSDYLREKLPALQEETLTAFNQINRASYPLRLPSGTATKYYLVPLHEIPPIFELKTKFPDASAVVKFSRVGFDTSKTQALVYRSIYWGPLAAVGELLLLSNENGWKIIATALLWIS